MLLGKRLNVIRDYSDQNLTPRQDRDTSPLTRT